MASFALEATIADRHVPFFEIPLAVSSLATTSVIGRAGSGTFARPLRPLRMIVPETSHSTASAGWAVVVAPVPGPSVALLPVGDPSETAPVAV